MIKLLVGSRHTVKAGMHLASMANFALIGFANMLDVFFDGLQLR